MRTFPQITLFFLCLIAGCVSSARHLSVSAVAKIKPGATTTAQVEELFGRPQETITGSNGKSVARYHYRTVRFSNDVRASENRDHPGDILLRTLSLRYNANGVIEVKLHDESVTPVYRYNAQYLAGPSLLPANLIFLQKNVTAKSELIDRLGEPICRTFDTDGNEVLIWSSAKVRADHMGDPDERRLIVVMNSNTVREYSVVMTDFPGVKAKWR